MVYDKLKGMIADQLGVSEDEVKPEARLKEDLKADSASVMMLVMDIESEFEIEVEDDAIEKVKTVADMVKYIEEKMSSGSGRAVSAARPSRVFHFARNAARSEMDGENGQERGSYELSNPGADHRPSVCRYRPARSGDDPSILCASA